MIGYVIAVATIALAVFVVVRAVIDLKKGKTGCSCGCTGSCASCHLNVEAAHLCEATRPADE